MDNMSENYDANLSHYLEPKGPSKMMSNKTYVMYHGTTSKNAESILASGFRPSSDGQLGQGVYLSRDLRNALRYPYGHPPSDKVVIQALVDVGKVVTINFLNHLCQKTWHDLGFDTANVPPNSGVLCSDLEEDCIWDPNRIRIIKIIRPEIQYDPWTSE